MKSNFKIIAIKALSECNSNFTKVLEKEIFYYFYSDYKINLNTNSEEIIIKRTSPENLFDISGEKRNLQINLSAIVGKNGSGKSSIIELLFRGINNLASNYLRKEGTPLKTITAELKIVEGVHLVFYYYSDAFYKVEIHDSEFKIYKFNSKNVLKINEDSIDSSFELMDFFYTEAVNYSHYAYNSLEFGYYKGNVFIDWLEELFHKNDSYQTPLVLNPMRTEGNFDINRENDLVTQRLLANILRLSKGKIDFRKFGDNLESKYLLLKLKPKKTFFSYWKKNKQRKSVEIRYDLGIYSTSERRSIISKFMLDVVDDASFTIDKLDDYVYSHAEMYLIYKITSICKKYAEYDGFINEKGKRIDENKIDELIIKIKDDSSHITFKLKQTLNFLKNDFINYKNGDLKISINDLSILIDNNLNENQLILELIPPPIFDIQILLENNETKEDVLFSTLSSGEKQLTYLISSLLYHLYNLDSVTGNKIIYKNINIVLEEIELYFHPEYQKTFIKYFLDSIEAIKLRNIESINICFLTHSPFILSDIPSNNIMFLEVVNGKTVQLSDKRKTFGANIHELLTDNFFMSDGYIGNFAKFKISNTIKWLNKILLQKIYLTENNLQSSDLNINKDELKFHKEIISLIDEEILKIKLGEMLSEILPDEDDFYNNLIREQIILLQSKIK